MYIISVINREKIAKFVEITLPKGWGMNSF